MDDKNNKHSIAYWTKTITMKKGDTFDATQEETRALLYAVSCDKGKRFLKDRGAEFVEVDRLEYESSHETGFFETVHVEEKAIDLRFNGVFDENGIDWDVFYKIGGAMSAWYKTRHPHDEPFKGGRRLYTDALPGIRFNNAAPFLVWEARGNLDDYRNYLDGVESDFDNLKHDGLARRICWACMYQFDCMTSGRRSVNRTKQTVFDYYPPLVSQLRALNTRALDLARKIIEVDDAFPLPFSELERRLGTNV